MMLTRMHYLSDYLSASFLLGCTEPHILHGHSSGEREGLASYSSLFIYWKTCINAVLWLARVTWRRIRDPDLSFYVQKWEKQNFKAKNI